MLKINREKRLRLRQLEVKIRPQPDAETERLLVEFSAESFGHQTPGYDPSKPVCVALHLEDVKQLAEKLYEAYHEYGQGALETE